VLDRRKQGFTMPISGWLRRELRDLPNAILLDPHAQERGLFEREAVERLITEHQRGTRDNSGKLWALIQLELWFRTYIDVEPKGPITLDFADVMSAREPVCQSEPLGI
jgi:asparagine synthase (glutamine-hydrolysing)